MVHDKIVAVVDTGMGHPVEIEGVMGKIAGRVRVTADKRELSQSSCIILYSTSSFAKTMHALHKKDLIHFLKKEAFSCKLLLGIGTGMHLLFTSSEEKVLYEGLNVLPGRCLKLPSRVDEWDELYFRSPHPLLTGLQEEKAYFSHSCYVEPTNPEDVLAVNSRNIPAIVGRRNLYGIQFLPEECGRWGESLLQQFVYANFMRL